MQRIDLLPLMGTSQDIVNFLTYSLGELFNVPCHILEKKVPIIQAYNNERKQYHSTEIIRRLLPLAEGNNHYVLGVVDVDLYIPILTFVYGEAQLNNRCALVSTYRLNQQFYGLPADEAVLLRRSEKEAAHELGHTLGLTHCPLFECVMHRSNSVEGIDIKRSVFCPVCSEQIGISSRW